MFCEGKITSRFIGSFYQLKQFHSRQLRWSIHCCLQVDWLSDSHRQMN